MKKRKQREQRAKKALRKWLKRKHPDWFVAPTSIRKPLVSYGQRFLSPDIDVLACDGPEKLIAFETKAPVERYKTAYKSRGRYQLFKSDWINKCQREGGLETTKGVAGLKYNLIYEGVGQALFHLRWADQSFLVLPELCSFYMVDPLQTVILHTLCEKLLSTELPIGLMEYDYQLENGQMKIGEFRYIYKAENSCLWQKPSARFIRQEPLYLQRIRELRDYLSERCLKRERRTKRR